MFLRTSHGCGARGRPGNHAGFRSLLLLCPGHGPDSPGYMAHQEPPALEVCSLAPSSPPPVCERKLRIGSKKLIVPSSAPLLLSAVRASPSLPCLPPESQLGGFRAGQPVSQCSAAVPCPRTALRGPGTLSSPEQEGRSRPVPGSRPSLLYLQHQQKILGVIYTPSFLPKPPFSLRNNG